MIIIIILLLLLLLLFSHLIKTLNFPFLLLCCSCFFSDILKLQLEFLFLDKKIFIIFKNKENGKNITYYVKLHYELFLKN
jgi:hypothetical protein